MKTCIASFLVLTVGSYACAEPAQKPLSITSVAPPAILLTMSRDHKLFYEAYNDAGDINGDGIVDTTYKPDTINYFGLFDSNKCYSYNSGSGYFEPTVYTATKKCSDQWSGDFLNYITTTRIDAVRRVLYGGMRSTDTATETVLERAYVPQDAHAFGKEWLSTAVNGYNLADYAPSSVIPASGRRVFFGNTTPLVSRSRTDLTTPPLLRIAKPNLTTTRIWDWLSKERPVAGTSMIGEGTVTLTDLIVRVKVCVPTLLESDCQGYPIANPTVYKPTGILHEFGQDNQMHFGLLTGSYDNNNDGGVLRKNVSQFSNEIELSNGTFKPTVTGIVHNINRFRMYGFGGGQQYDCGWNVGDPSTSGQNCEDWGNPIAEMMYEGLRYFAGKTTPTAAYTAGGASKDTNLGLTRPAWIDPFKSASNSNGLPYCSKPVQMVISDIYASFDSDKVPGTSFGSFSGDLPGLDATAIGNTLSGKESISGRYFIGQSGSNFDKISSAKDVAGFGTVRGLAPDEPTRAGSYYSASVAHYGKGTDLRTDLNDGGWAQTVDTYSIALASPLPKIQIPIGDPADKRFVTVVPFGKSVGGYGISPNPSSYQPTNQIVDFYIEEIVNQPGFPTDSSRNDGRPYGRFRINFEDVEQGADHDMDAIAEYTYALLADGRVRIRVDASRYAAGSIIQHMGYILNGTTADGTYLVVRDQDTCDDCDPNYYLDFKPSDGSRTKNGLPLISTEVFTPGPAGAKFIPENPLWYAAKYGGSPDRKLNGKIAAIGVNGDLEPGWSKTTDPTQPANYFLVTDAGKLRDELRRAFIDIQSKIASGTAATTGTTALTARSRAYEAEYNSTDWTGEVRGYRVAKNGVRTFMWRTTDADSFPADKTQRNVLTYWNGTPFEFRTTGANALPAAAASTFALSSLYTSMESDATLNWTTKTPAEKQSLAFEVLVNYIRGDKSKEKAQGKGALRDRTRLLGDIVNSNVVYASDTDYGFSGLPGAEGTSYAAYVASKASSSAYKTVYVGANDGMLHAFDAETGSERFAFVPSSISSKLFKLALPGYQHQYFVDGRLELSDAYRGSGWTTVLLGSTGAGGRSVFALDVGSPTGSTSNVLWEFKDDDLGFPIGIPAIVRTSGNNGRWVAVFANGYYGAGKKAVLFVLDLFTGAELTRINLESTSGVNGLGSVAVHKVAGNVNQIYAGDLLGNMWKIDASASNPTSWSIANSGLPVLKATDATGKPQPITAQASVALLGAGTQVFFGTGKLFDDGDRDNVDPQAVYGLWLQSDPGKTLTRNDLVRQYISSQSTDYRALGNPTATGSEMGWVLDLVAPGGAAPTGERVISTVHYSFGTADFKTWYLGGVDACQPGGESWLMSIPGDTGVVSAPLFDIDGNGLVNSLDKVSGKPVAGIRVEGSISDPLINFTHDDPSSKADKGSYQVGGNNQLSKPPLAAGSCPPCSKWIGSGTSTSGNSCRPVAACSPDSWIQLQ